MYNASMISAIYQCCRTSVETKSHIPIAIDCGQTEKQTSASLTSLPLHWRDWTITPPPQSQQYIVAFLLISDQRPQKDTSAAP